MTELRVLDPRERRRVYETLYKTAFPPTELRPLRSIESLTAAGAYRTLGLYEGREPLAYASVFTAGRYVLIDYLCVPEGQRNRGLGALLLKTLRESFPPGSVLFGESEAPTGDPERDGLILRRLDFYRRCGAETLSYDTWLFGVHYKTLAWRPAEVSEEEIQAAHRDFYRMHMPRALFDRAVRIPYGGEALPKFDHWEDEKE